MQLLKRFFAAPAPHPPVLEEPQPVVEDTLALDKAQVRDFVEQSLSELYRTEEPADLVLEELCKVSSVSEINVRLKELERCFQVVNHGLYLDVMENYDKFVSGMENIHMVDNDLRESKEMARLGRQRLKELRSVFLDRAMIIVAKQTRRLKIEGLRKELQVFGEVCLQTSLRINQATDEGELYQALLLCAEATATLNSVDVRKFPVYKKITSDVEMKRGKVFLRMKESLTQLCFKFDARLYENVLLAYTSTASFQEVNSAIHEEFMLSTSRRLKETVEEFVRLNETSVSLESLVRHIPTESYVQCMRRVAKRLSRLLYNHHLFSRWHEENDQQNLNSSDGFTTTKQFITSPERLTEVLRFYTLVKTDLLRSRKHLWAKMQEKFALFIRIGDQLDIVSSPDICKALGWANTLIEIGEDFSGESSNDLKEAVAMRCKRWFGFFHQTSWNKLA